MKNNKEGAVMDKRLADITNPSTLVTADGCENLCFKLLDSMLEGMCILEVRGRKVKALYMNNSFFETIGFTKEQYLPYLDNVTVMLFEEDEQCVLEHVKESIKNGTGFKCEVRGYRNDGTVGYYLIKVRPADFIKSDYPVFTVAFTDITYSKQLEQELAKRNERCRLLENNVSDYFLEYSILNDTMTFNSCRKNRSFTIENYSMYLRREETVHPSDANYFFNILCKACRRKHSGVVYVRTINEERSDYVICRITYSSVDDGYGRIMSVIGRAEVLCDDDKSVPQLISEMNESVLEFTDTFEEGIEKINEIIADGRRDNYMIVADIDCFEEYNKKYSSEAADKAIAAAAKAIRDVFGSAIIFRYIGDEFVIFAEGLTEVQIYNMFDRLRAAVSCIAVNEETDESAGLTFSAGAAYTANTSEKVNIRDYFITADKALYRAKSEGRDRLCAEKIIY